MKQVEFDIELVKKIQSGEVKGCIKTRDGRIARFLGVMKNNRYPLAFVCAIDEFDEEGVLCNTINGSAYYGGTHSDDDIIIEIEEPKHKCQFKPFDKVLVRDRDTQCWSCSLFSHTKSTDGYNAGGLIWSQCIPYEGNEHLVGTTGKPKEE